MYTRRAFGRFSLGWVLALGILVCVSWGRGEVVPPVEALREGVVLLHGLTRTPRSMRRMAKVLEDAGYVVANVGYPSRKKTIGELAEPTVLEGVEACREAGALRIHFVTHSMGGILLRYYLKEHEIAGLGRVVMLSPPNHGSQVTDKIGHLAPYRWLNGPAGDELGTGSESVPRTLGPLLDVDFGIMTGSHTINFILSMLIPGRDDGKVSPASAKLEGMADFRIMPVSHPFIMRDRDVIKEVHHFLVHGEFSASE